MVFENGVNNIQAAAYNGARMVGKSKLKQLEQPHNQFQFHSSVEK